MFIFLQPNIQNNTSRRVIYDYYRDTALRFTTYDSIKEYNTVSYNTIQYNIKKEPASTGVFGDRSYSIITLYSCCFKIYICHDRLLLISPLSTDLWLDYVAL